MNPSWHSQRARAIAWFSARDGIATLLLLAALAAVRIERSPGAFLRPLILFEDGVFLTHFWGQPARALGWSYAGYTALVPNAVAWLAQFLPLGAVRYAQSTWAFAAGLLPSVILLSSPAARVWPSWRERAFLASLAALAPTGDAIFHSLSVYSIWNLLLAAALLACFPTAATVRAELPWLLVSLLAVVSHPLCVVCAPLWWLRAWRQRDRVALLAAVVLTVALAAYLSSGVGPHAPLDTRNLGLRWVLYVCAAVFGEALLGNDGVAEMCGRSLGAPLRLLGGFLVAALAGLVTLALHDDRKDGTYRRSLGAMLYIVFALPTAAVTARNLADACDTSSHRYLYDAQTLLVVLVGALVIGLLRAAPSRRAFAVSALCWCVLSAELNVVAWRMDPERSADRALHEFFLAAAKREAQGGAPVLLRLERDPWSVVITVPREGR